MARMTANDDLLGNDETERYGEISSRGNHVNRTLGDRIKEQKRQAEAQEEETNKENRRRRSAGLPEINTQSQFGRTSDVARLEQQNAEETEDVERKVREMRRRAYAR